jgi:alpha-glucosidase
MYFPARHDTGRFTLGVTARGKPSGLAVAVSLWLACVAPVYADECKIEVPYNSRTEGEIDVEAFASNIVGIHVLPAGRLTPRTLVLDAALRPNELGELHCDRRVISSPVMSVIVGNTGSVEVEGASHHVLLAFKNIGAAAADRSLDIVHNENERLYGMRGLGLVDTGAGILRPSGAIIKLGQQGDGGAPFFFTTKYGVLVDSDGGSFESRDATIRFTGSSRPDMEFFAIVGEPMEIMKGLAKLTGKAPMPPRWTLGFLNSQWGATETEINRIASSYRKRNIPISGFILDYDWKAWGEDNYGEWRWNSTAGPGNADPDKFPNGASGKFASGLLENGIHLVGILKPRVLVNNADGTQTEASAYATTHNFWYPSQLLGNDYLTHRPARDIDFGNPEARAWYWQHLIPSFQAGIKAFWNDEADYSDELNRDNFQFLNMGRAIYDGQRHTSDERVWSINRAYYLGSLRYGFALWSGDINTGFPSMAYQRRRMISALDLGEPYWSMDTGGFVGHPTAENYARWMEFAAFVPIYRVHGELNEKRQPWVYGPIAEAAAKRAIRLRYDLLPYIYSNAHSTTKTGIGIARPLFWVFPNDPHTGSETRSWMFGDALLVSPVVERAATTHTFYLPGGRWIDFWSGGVIEGGKEISVPVDAQAWDDIPLYIRDGSILATQSAEVGYDRLRVPLVLDIFPSSSRTAEFSVYDDDGHTYAYEKGSYFQQQITASRRPKAVVLTLAPSTGNFKTTIPSYVLRVHAFASDVSRESGKITKFASEATLIASTKLGWTTGNDRFGAVTLIRLPVGDCPLGTRFILTM